MLLVCNLPSQRHIDAPASPGDPSMSAAAPVFRSSQSVVHKSSSHKVTAKICGNKELSCAYCQLTWVSVLCALKQ